MTIRTTHIRPPIPDRQFDWSAVHDDYDGAEDSSTRNHIGYGRTEAEAIADLERLDQELAEANGEFKHDSDPDAEWPYSPTKGQCEAMGPAALEWWWKRYAKYWRGYECHDNKVPRMDRDDNDPTLREWGLDQRRIGD